MICTEAALFQGTYIKGTLGGEPRLGVNVDNPGMLFLTGI